ncbi:MAG: hypothetical protein ACLRFL_00405 [Clostridia bacterium]
MTKKRSINLFIIFAIVLVICLVACFVNFTYPLSVDGNYYSYSNFISNIRLGNDIDSSLRIVYRAEVAEGQSKLNYDALRDDVIKDLSDIVNKEGYYDVSSVKYGEDGILLNIGNILTAQEKDTLIDLVGNPQSIGFSKNSDGSDPFVKSESISKVYATSYNDPETGLLTYCVVVEFADEYKSTMVEKSEEGDIYIYIGDQQFGSITKGNITEEGIISFTSDSFVSMQTTNTCVNQIKVGMLGLELTQIECNMISAGQGSFANIFLGVAMVAFMIALFVLLIVKFRHMGLVSSFAMLFFVVISLFLIQSIPFVHVNFGGIIGMMVALLLAVESIMRILDIAKNHYQNGTPLYVAFKMAMKESLARTMFINAFLLVAGLVCLFMPTMAVQSFGWIIFISSIVSTFVSMALMRLFIKMYLALNNTDGKKLNFHKGGKNA